MLEILKSLFYIKGSLYPQLVISGLLFLFMKSHVLPCMYMLIILLCVDVYYLLQWKFIQDYGAALGVYNSEIFRYNKQLCFIGGRWKQKYGPI